MTAADQIRVLVCAATFSFVGSLSGAAIADPMAYLVQQRCPDGAFPFVSPCPGAAFQYAADPMLWRRHDWSGTGGPLAGYQANDDVLADDGKRVIHLFSFAPFGGFVAGNGDGGEVLVIDGPAVRIEETQDSGTPMQYFVGATCPGGTGWIAFKDDAPSGRWASLIARLADAPSAEACPALGAAFTRYRLEEVDIPFLVGGGQRTISLPTVISEHYSGASIAEASAMERTYFAQGIGLVRWESWSTLKPEGNLAGRNPPMPFSAAPGTGWNQTDVRHWTNVRPANGALSVNGVGWSH